jgi:hypothetical protein
LKSDVVIIGANAVSLALLMGILHFKICEHRALGGNERAGRVCGTQRGIKFLSKEER